MPAIIWKSWRQLCYNLLYFLKCIGQLNLINRELLHTNKGDLIFHTVLSDDWVQFVVQHFYGPWNEDQFYQFFPDIISSHHHGERCGYNKSLSNELVCSPLHPDNIFQWIHEFTPQYHQKTFVCRLLIAWKSCGKFLTLDFRDRSHRRIAVISPFVYPFQTVLHDYDPKLLWQSPLQLSRFHLPPGTSIWLVPKISILNY